MTEIEKNKGELLADMVEIGRNLSNAIEDARQKLDELTSQYSQLPQEVLETLAWQGIARFHGAPGVATGRMYGWESEEYKRMERIKDQRLAALPDEESRDRAINEANSWLDDNFSE